MHPLLFHEIRSLFYEVFYLALCILPSSVIDQGQEIVQFESDFEDVLRHSIEVESVALVEDLAQRSISHTLGKRCWHAEQVVLTSVRSALS